MTLHGAILTKRAVFSTDSYRAETPDDALVWTFHAMMLAPHVTRDPVVVPVGTLVTPVCVTRDEEQYVVLLSETVRTTRDWEAAKGLVYEPTHFLTKFPGVELRVRVRGWNMLFIALAEMAQQRDPRNIAIGFVLRLRDAIYQ